MLPCKNIQYQLNAKQREKEMEENGESRRKKIDPHSNAKHNIFREHLKLTVVPLLQADTSKYSLEIASS